MTIDTDDNVVAIQEEQFSWTHREEVDFALAFGQSEGERRRLAAHYRDLLNLRRAVRYLAKADYVDKAAANMIEAMIKGRFERDRQRGLPMRITKAAVRREAILMGREATRPMPWEANPEWVNPYDTEYYSADGYADGLLMRREEAQADFRWLAKFRRWLGERAKRYPRYDVTRRLSAWIQIQHERIARGLPRMLP